MKNLTVTVNGVAYNVTVEENTNGAAPVAAAPLPLRHPRCTCSAAAPAAPAAAGSVPVNAPMPGTILDIKVKAALLLRLAMLS